MKNTMMTIVAAAALMATTLPAAASETCAVRIECESFESHGGWVNDTQFMDQMGSPYLLAHGLGRPVANAKTFFRVSCDGRPHPLQMFNCRKTLDPRLDPAVHSNEQIR